MIPGDLDPRYRAVLSTTESYLVTYPGNLGALDLAPLGVPVPAARRYDPTSLAALPIIDRLHRLDAATFGDQDMRMPRWVLYDCGAFPGVVYGFGRRARDLPDPVRAHYGVADDDEAFVPLSMWIAVRCAEDGAWFGHNLASANLLPSGEARLAGLATVTKALGLRLVRATKQYGATQWDSPSLAVHLRFGDLHLLSAYTPAHTHPATLSYRLDVDEARIRASLHAAWRRPEVPGDRVIDAGDVGAIRALQDEIEQGVRYRIVQAERAGSGQRLHVCRS